MKPVAIVQKQGSKWSQLVLTTLQPSCNCNVAMIATHSIVMLQLHTWKIKFIKYSLHGSRFVKHIFSNNLMQIDLKSELRFKRYCIFLSKSIKYSLHAVSWWVAGLSCGWLASPAEGLCICYSKCTYIYIKSYESIKVKND